MKPTPEDIIVDPACGTAGFLVEAGEYLRKNKDDLFYNDLLYSSLFLSCATIVVSLVSRSLIAIYG